MRRFLFLPIFVLWLALMLEAPPSAQPASAASQPMVDQTKDLEAHAARLIAEATTLYERASALRATAPVGVVGMKRVSEAEILERQASDKVSEARGLLAEVRRLRSGVLARLPQSSTANDADRLLPGRVTVRPPDPGPAARAPATVSVPPPPVPPPPVTEPSLPSHVFAKKSAPVLHRHQRASAAPLRETPAPAVPPAINQADPVVVLATETKRIDSLVTGSAAVSAPQHVREGEPFNLYLRVSRAGLDELLNSLASDAPGNATRRGKTGVKLTPRMVATVHGFGFEFTPKESVPQAVSASEMTTWDWQAEATESGDLTIMFSLAGTLIVEGKEVPRDFYSYQQQVHVDVSPMGFVGRNWQWLSTSLVLPAFGALWVAFRRPKTPGDAPRLSFVARMRGKRFCRNKRDW